MNGSTTPPSNMPTSRRRKPLLVGESNPYGSDPAFALYPSPDGCSGHRLCYLILGMWGKDYLREFERVNLCAGKWSMLEARRRAEELSVPTDRPVILLGSKVTAAFLPDLPFLPFTRLDRAKLVVLPHPSGRCRLWNEPGAIARTRALVAEIAPSVAQYLGNCDHLYAES